MISRIELDRLIKSLPKEGLVDDEWRAAASVATGVFHEKNLPDIIKFYSLNESLAKKWWDRFNFSDIGLAREKSKKSKPQIILDSYVKNNIGQTVTVKLLAEDCDVSTPTIYSYLDSNRHWFKKISRGTYEIIDAEKEREKAKNNDKQ
jgi:hypothetical protein